MAEAPQVFEGRADDVSAGVWSLHRPEGRYDFAIHGPNGFFREVVGRLVDGLEVQADDRILLKVPGPGFQELRDTEGIAFDAEKRFHLKELEKRQLKLMEGIVGPHSTLVGRTLKDLRFRQRFGVQILAIHRQGQDLRADFGDVRLHFGDVLLIQGSVDAINRANERGERLVRIHAVGFPVQFARQGALQATGVRFAALMRELTSRHGGTFVGLNDWRR